jgi:predicted transcriptional regulator of viral defense system
MNKKHQLIDFIKNQKICRVRTAEKNGFRRRDFSALLAEGKIERIGRGLYQSAGISALPNQGILELALHAPNAIVCLLSALHFHNLTTQVPRVIWCAVEGTARAPRLGYPTLKVVRFSGSSYSEGIEIQKIENIPVKVYSVAKTVVDLFRFRNKTGLDIAMEALREAIRTRKATRDEIRKMAIACRAYNIMRPYMEMETVS